MVSDLRSFAYKDCKMATKKKVSFLAKFALLSGLFWPWCYSPHLSRDALSCMQDFYLEKKNFFSTSKIIIVDILTVDIMMASLVFVTYRKSG